MASYKIGKYTFTDENEYLAARRDAKKISGLKRSGRTAAQIAASYKQQIKDEHIEFESVVGEEFVEGLDQSLFVAPSEATIRRRERKRIPRARKMNAWKAGTIIAFSISFVVVGFAFAKQLMMDVQSEEELHSLSEMAEQAADAADDGMSETAVTEVLPETVFEEQIYELHRTILPKYQELYERNNDLAGWLRISDIVDYPVMYLPDDNDYYLKHNFDKEEDQNGLLVLDKRCNADASGLNILIHGHHMKSGRMFGNLKYYRDPAYYQEHPYIYFDSLYEERTYGIIAVFVSSVYNSNEGEFAYYDYINIDNEEAFNTYVQSAKELALYDTGMTAEYGDELITLSTCEYSRSNGRLVIVGRRLMQ